MKKIYLTGKLGKGKFALVDDEDFELLNKYKWHYLNVGYAVRKKNGKITLLHREIMNTPKNLVVDHINRNKLDNRRSNLKNCTKSENEWNRGNIRSNTSGYKGVSWANIKGWQRWVVNIKVNGKKKTIGYFTNIDEAVKKYQEVTLKYHKGIGGY